MKQIGKNTNFTQLSIFLNLKLLLKYLKTFDFNIKHFHYNKLILP